MVQGAHCWRELGAGSPPCYSQRNLQVQLVVKSGFGFQARVERTSCSTFLSVSNPATDKLLGEGLLKAESLALPMTSSVTSTVLPPGKAEP